MNFGPYEYVRCNRASVCPICGRDKYCAISADGLYVLCTKIPDGAIKQWKRGWLHAMSEPRKIIAPPKLPPIVPETIRAIYACLDRSIDAIAPLALSLGLPAGAFQAIGTGRVPKADIWGTPMYDENKQVIGVKYRDLHRKKWCVRGSRLGVYMALDIPMRIDRPLFVPEGESDTATAIMRGYNVLGRPSAECGEDIILNLSTGFTCIVTADTDEGVGLRTAKELAARMQPAGHVLYNPAYKDFRDWVLSGTFELTTMNHYFI